MKIKVIVITVMAFCMVMMGSCGASADRSQTEANDINIPSNRVNTTTTPNRVNTNTTTNRVDNTTIPDTRNVTSDPVNNPTTSNNTAISTNQNRVVNDPRPDPKHTVETDRLKETTTSKEHLDDNATLTRRNENTETVERKERIDDIHNADQSNKVQATAAANARRTLYSTLNMTQAQIQQLESVERDYQSEISDNALAESEIDKQIRMDKYFKEVLTEDQYRKYETWKRENPNTRF